MPGKLTWPLDDLSDDLERPEYFERFLAVIHLRNSNLTCALGESNRQRFEGRAWIV